MHLFRIRKFSSWICLVATGVLFSVSTLQAKTIPSQLAAASSHEEARRELVQTLATEQLVDVGLKRQDARLLVEVAFESGATELVDQRDRLTDPNYLRSVLPKVQKEFAQALARRGQDTDALASRCRQEVLASFEGNWVSEQGAAFAAGAESKVVGLNWGGLMLLVLPLVGIAWVMIAAGSGGGATVLTGLVVGVILVLWVDPSFIFGSRGGGDADE